MKHSISYQNLKKFSPGHLADVSGLLASGICFIHCWGMPVILFFLPHLAISNDLVHSVLCGIALLSTIPLFSKGTQRLNHWSLQLALVTGVLSMSIILFAHDHLSFAGELALSSIGGLCLASVHCHRLRKE